MCEPLQESKSECVLVRMCVTQVKLHQGSVSECPASVLAEAIT